MAMRTDATSLENAIDAGGHTATGHNRRHDHRYDIKLS
jgi:hypothetical protein